jgi:hypothetical protein
MNLVGKLGANGSLPQSLNASFKDRSITPKRVGDKATDKSSFVGDKSFENQGSKFIGQQLQAYSLKN